MGVLCSRFSELQSNIRDTLDALTCDVSFGDTLFGECGNLNFTPIREDLSKVDRLADTIREAAMSEMEKKKHTGR